MDSIINIILYTLVFLSVYAQIFFFVTFLENRKKIITHKGETTLAVYPSVTITVPCWNEESTIHQTVQSLLNLNYPKDKLKIFLVDDGSTDNTWNVIKQFEGYENIKIFHKENGGKYTALNLGISHTETEFFGALDADSFAHKEALIRIMSCFEKSSDIMAVVPSIVVNNPKNLIQNAQKAEYQMGIYFKKMLGFMDAINVTPGPLGVFRKKVFDDFGPYKHAYNTEDMEIACRIQKNNYKIEHCNDAYIYTNAPETLKKLYKQRLRWGYGFINNTLDYKEVLFKKKYGNFSMFSLPIGVFSIFTVSCLFLKMIYDVLHFLYVKIVNLNVTQWHFAHTKFHIDLFFVNLSSFSFLVIIIYSLVVFAILFGRKMSDSKGSVSLSIIYFFIVFRLIAPIWFLKAIYDTITRRQPSWR